MLLPVEYGALHSTRAGILILHLQIDIQGRRLARRAAGGAGEIDALAQRFVGGNHDLGAGTVTEHHFGAGCTPSEFVFVPAGPDAAENEGWLMGYVHTGATDTSSLQILDATDVAAPPVARVELGHRVPQGFHGNWMPEGGA